MKIICGKISKSRPRVYLNKSQSRLATLGQGLDMNLVKKF